ncbi:MAG: ABC transporter substrate-binding protein [Alteromonadaceae bacterium]|nr:MAG: ABC transporter substrate-binding protein [Alteromonadaceae bacterium]
MRKALILAFTIILSMLISACSDNNDGTPPPASAPVSAPTIEPKADTSYIEKGDIDAIKKRGIIRLIAPMFDNEQALPRRGIPLQHYQAIAEQFGKNHRLDVEWVFVDGFDQLIPSLNNGHGDVIITNLTATEQREREVLFSLPVHYVKELIVTHNTLNIAEAADLEGLTVSVPKGQSYIETLNKLKTKNEGLTFNIEVLPASLNNKALLTQLSENKLQAIALDSDIAEALLPDYPELKTGLTLNKRRAIAWAVRKDNTKLLNLLNQHLISHLVKADGNQEQKRNWQAIQKSGQLRMITVNNPASYFMWRGELMGFDYELTKKFAAQHNLALSVIVKDSIQQCFEALKNGEGDVISASLSVSDTRKKQGILFSKRYLKVAEQLIGTSDSPKIREWSQALNYRIGLNPETIFFDKIQQTAQTTNTPLSDNLIQYPGENTEGLIHRMLAGEFDFTIADSHLVALQKAYNPDIQVKLTLTEEADIAWALRPEQTELQSHLNAFISKQYRGLFYNVTYNKHFKNARKIKKLKKDRITPGQALSPYDDLIKPLAKQHDLDWRLIVAQMYQESKFNPKAKSFAGAIGLMQMLPKTAKQLGFKQLTKPENSITAGIIYMKWLEQRFPGELNIQQRLYFSLAAYNAGIGHVRDARTLARRLGKDPNQWFGHVEQAMLLLSKPKYHRKARYGYVRGREPVAYVKTIRDRYLAYLSAIE